MYSQLMHLQNTECLVIARDLRHLDDFPGLTIQAFSSEPVSWFKRWADLNYGFLHWMSRYEQDFFTRVACEFDPQVLHAHYVVDAAYFASLKSELAQPLIVSCYGYDVSSFPRRYLGYGHHYLRRAFDVADVFLAMSEDMKRDLLNLGVEEQKILIHHPNGVDLNRFRFIERQPGPGGKIRVLFVGSFKERKGAKYLLEAFAKVCQHNSSVELRMIGDGPLRSQIEAQIKALDLTNNVTLVGFLDYDRLLEEYEMAHLFCLPCVTSKTGNKEGIPTVLIEAQATGLPVVSTWHAGIPEAVVDGVSGHLVPERDSEALAQRLIELIDHSACWGQLGRAGRAHISQHFDADKLALKLEEIYEHFRN